ncbi:hypothetical protein O0I10_010294 [Lichtheimia ornata]|uniref:CBM21 domain-containing protein n=1 Tax=Lichtheimia ornata TaxID=688661 RepID=A0AAD7XV26_9FUNG|nr:uncharacterized protein O0I10_010294 [Lichtheimia ornata]KAJ8654083.1 hypothetical protein O0I10_010294 [Lichtheimia ornata]
MTFISASSLSSSSPSFSPSSSSLPSPNTISELSSHNSTEQRANAHSQLESNDGAKHRDNRKASAMQRLLRSKHWVLTPPDTDRFRFCFKEPTTCSSDVPDDSAPIESAAAAKTKTTRIVSYKVDRVAASREHNKPEKDTPIKFEDIDVAPTSADSNSSSSTLLGHCIVLNLAFEKRIIARYTLDNWITFTDTDATHVESVVDDKYDRFSFTIPVQEDFSADDEDDHHNELDIQLALCYCVDHVEHWDNNGGENYHIKVVHSITVVHEDNKKDHQEDEEEQEQPVMWMQKTSALANDTHISPWTTSRFWIPGYMRHSQMTFARDNYDIEFLPPTKLPEQEQDEEDEKLTTPVDGDIAEQQQGLPSNDHHDEVKSRK